MSTKFEQHDPHNMVNGQFDITMNTNNGNLNPNDNDMDILDEFLDKRLYDDHAIQSADQLNQSVVKDEEIFSNFLTDEINKNDFVLFSPQNDNKSPDSSSEFANDSLINQFNTRTPSFADSNVSPKQEVFSTPTSIGANDASYDYARNVLSQLKFGTEAPLEFNNELPRSYLDADESTLPYQLSISNLPSYSRVETQIKLAVSISPPPPQYLVHLPSDTIAKQKFCLDTPLTPEISANILFLETFVLTASTSKPCNICTRCIRREQKRSSRRKSGVSDNMNWSIDANKRAIIFNCKEVISFSPSSITETSKHIDISARIVCYCRHHHETKGFKLLFILKDSQNNIIAKHLSTPIMIMDRKKTLDENGSNSALGNTNSDSNAIAVKLQPPSPTSIEEDSSEPHTTDSRVFKRKKTWSPELSDGFSITPQRKTSSSLGLMNLSSINSSMLPVSNDDTLPKIQRVIPAQGPLRGGIEVTLLGSNFKQGLAVKFGINKALSTQCWSDTTIVTYLPPSSQPGQVVVTIEDPEQGNASTKGNAIFTYLDDTDRQMIELALQIVGLKMNGKLEDARNIARKIIGSDSNGDGSQQNRNLGNVIGNNALSLSNISDEELILKVINLLPANPNLALCTSEGQTLLHLSCLSGYYKLVTLLLQKGARVDLKDTNGFTPLHFASIKGDRPSIELLLNCKASLDVKSKNGLTPEQVADPNVLDLFKTIDSTNMSRKLSNSSISSSIFSIDYDWSSGLHVSRLTTDEITDDINTDTNSGPEIDDMEAGDEESESDYGNGEDEYDEYDFDEYDYDFDNRDDSTTLFQREEVPVATEPIDVNGTSERPTDGSIWNKVKHVFQEELPKYDDLFPSRNTKLSFKSPIITRSTTERRSRLTMNPSVENFEEGSDSEDIFQKFFNQRKNFQNDKMLLFFWLPLLFLIVSTFILVNTGWSFEFNDQCQEFIRKGLGTIMLGNERVKIVLNKHLSSMNDAVTSVINVA